MPSCETHFLGRATPFPTGRNTFPALRNTVLGPGRRMIGGGRHAIRLGHHGPARASDGCDASRLSCSARRHSVPLMSVTSPAAWQPGVGARGMVASRIPRGSPQRAHPAAVTGTCGMPIAGSLQATESVQSINDLSVQGSTFPEACSTSADLGKTSAARRNAFAGSGGTKTRAGRAPHDPRLAGRGSPEARAASGDPTSGIRGRAASAGRLTAGALNRSRSWPCRWLVWRPVQPLAKDARPARLFC